MTFSAQQNAKLHVLAQKAARSSGINAAYAAARPSAHRRRRTELGGYADAHLARGLDYWLMYENARDMDRNDWNMGQLLDRYRDNVVKEGIKPDPKTGDTGLDTEIKERWKEWANDPFMCDIAGRHDFYAMQGHVIRAAAVDGDMFAIPLDSGHIQLKETHEVYSPDDQYLSNTVLGVQQDRNGRPQRYYFAKPMVGEKKRIGYRHKRAQSEFNIIDAFYDDGQPRVVHYYDPKRINQTRGVTAFKAIFDLSTMIEDGAFAKLIQQQVASCIGLFVKSARRFKVGKTDTLYDQQGDILEHSDMSPGTILFGDPSDSVETVNPSVQSAEWKELMLFFLRIYGAQIGMPLSLAMLDTSNSNFHGYRGELQQAYLGFKRVVRNLNTRFNAPIYLHRLYWWFPEIWADERRRRALIRHTWQSPGWPYVDPTKDAQADQTMVDGHLSSYRRIVAERGIDWDDLAKEIVEDKKLLITHAIEAADEINTTHPDAAVSWREVLGLLTEKGAGNGPRTDNSGNEDPDAEGARSNGPD